MKKILIFTLFNLFSFALIGQQVTITGTITSAEDGLPLPGVSVIIKGSSTGTTANIDGYYSIAIPKGSNAILQFNYIGYITQEIRVKDKTVIDVKLEPDLQQLEEVVVIGYGTLKKKGKNRVGAVAGKAYGVQGNNGFKPKKSAKRNLVSSPTSSFYYNDDFSQHNTEEYDVINENIFLKPTSNPLSTFSIDVDAASYSNLRRMLTNGQTPPVDAVRIEEMVNYFDYNYQNPEGDHPFSIAMELSQAPWNEKHQLVHIGIQGKKLDYENLQPSNLVFLIDVSGSMNNQNKLPLLKSSLKLLLEGLSENDKISIVTYAGAAGLALPPTSAANKEKIIRTLDNLNAGGSTAGGQGIKLAYKIAKENLVDGNNRVILCTDGDFNVGVSSTSEMVRLIEEKRKDGIYLTIAGFGMGNYKDGRMEQISNAGNGNYYYIDNIKEAQKVFVTDMRATLFTIAKDVKIQVEFNPELVQAYRLIGYENRALKDEDFNDDTKDAGELGAGHTVTALYEIIPVGIKSKFVKDVDKLKYQQVDKIENGNTGELLTVKFRYKKPDQSKSRLITQVLESNPIPLDHTSDNFRFSAAVAEFGMILRNSEFKENANYEHVEELAKSAIGNDENGYRREFIQMISSCKLLSKR